jgi:multidrug efflux pump subunit AcrA (membrane-fusion protein)
LRTAEAALRQAQGAYDRAYSRNPGGISGDPAALALEKATNDHQAAQALYNVLSRPADAAQRSAARQQVAAAQAQLDRLLQPAQRFEVEQSLAGVESAQARLDELKAGARPEQLAAAKAQVAVAEAALAGLEAQRSRYALTAPASATVLSRAVEAGEMALPGVPVLVLGDLERLRVETTDLSERDVAAVAVGQSVVVIIKALNQRTAGRVSAIAPLASTLGGDVVYQVTVELETRPAGLRAGMSVEVQFGQGKK